MPTMAEVATKAFKLRTQIEDEESAFKRSKKEKSSLLEKLENWMLAKLQEEGTQRMAVPGVGTVFIQKTTSVKIEDWDVTLEWIKEHDRYDMLNHAINKTATVQHIEDTGSPPPGVSYTAINTVGMQVERKKSE